MRRIGLSVSLVRNGCSKSNVISNDSRFLCLVSHSMESGRLIVNLSSLGASEDLWLTRCWNLVAVCLCGDDATLFSNSGVS